jgi:hypothetical protein
MEGSIMIDFVRRRTGYGNGEVFVAEEQGQPCVKAYIEDLEIDQFEINFSCAGTFCIVPGELQYLMLDLDIMGELVGMLCDAMAKWAELDKHYDEAQDGYVGWEHMITPQEGKDEQ